MDQNNFGLDVAESRKVFVQNAGGSMIELENHQAVWNMNQDILGCIASKEYKIIQHNAVAISLFSAIKNLNLKFTHSIKQCNNRLFIDISFPDTKLSIMKGEEFIGGLRIINSYNKSTGFIIVPRLDRVICSNGMVMGKFIEGYSIKHTAKLVESFQGVIEKALKSIINSSPKLKAIIEDCLQDSVEYQLAEKVLYNLLRSERHSKAIVEKLGKVRNLTRWDIYNAVTDYASHNAQLKPTVEQSMQMKAQKLLVTPTIKLQELQIPASIHSRNGGARQ